MTAHTDFAYAQARLQARHGGLPGASHWQVLEASRTAGHCLSLARAGPLATWVEALDDSCDVHRVERHLRARWRRYVGEVERWLPPNWRATTRWFGTLAELPLIDAWRRTGQAPRWLHADVHLATLALPDSAERDKALHDRGLAPFAALGNERDVHTEGSGRVAAIWRDEWQRLAPSHGPDASLMRAPAELLLPQLLGESRGRSAPSEPVRRALLQLFRRHAASPVAAFAHLALVALDVERLRGGLVERILLEPGRAPPEA